MSAASKFLWLRHQSPIVIFDSQAVAFLRRHGAAIAEGSYRDFRAAWALAYNGHHAEIRTACGELNGVRDFSLGSGRSNRSLADLTSAQWFQERVFDFYLWWNGGPLADGVSAEDGD